MGEKKTLLIYAPVPLFRSPDGSLMLEGQAINGLRLWAENFENLIVMMPIGDAPPPPDWRSLDELGAAKDRIEIHPLPMAYRPDKFLFAYRKTRNHIRALIKRADYLSFAIGGLFGDWGAVASLQAHRVGRPFAVWTDRVESAVTRQLATQGSLKERLRARFTHRPMARLEKAVIGRASLGLFHGRETYDAYAPWCKNPHVVHDIHIARSDQISPTQLAAKQAAVSDDLLRICYVGRAEDMKGPFDWIDALQQVSNAGVSFEAHWLGDGTQHAEMLRRIEAAGLANSIHAPGFTSNRADVLNLMREAHLFVFCHKTPESPRNLIEALTSGTPLVGYDGAFARDLTKENDGSVLVPIGDTQGLASQIIALANDRGRLAQLIGMAAADGRPFDDVSVFRHRSELIKSHLADT